MFWHTKVFEMQYVLSYFEILFQQGSVAIPLKLFMVSI